jgi:hypothetical protein
LFGSKSIDDWFAALRASYPKRRGGDPPKPARDLFIKAVRKGADPQAICSAAATYARLMASMGRTDTPYVEKVEKWLRNERWLEVSEWQAELERAPPGPERHKSGSLALLSEFAHAQHLDRVEGLLPSPSARSRIH